MSDFTAAWGWPQWVLVALLLLELIGKCANHGKPRADYNGFMAMLDVAALLFILIAGGFFA